MRPAYAASTWPKATNPAGPSAFRLRRGVDATRYTNSCVPLDSLLAIGKGLAVCPVEPSHSEAIVAVLGASAGLGGLMLVFLGLLINLHQGYPADTPSSVTDKSRTAGWRVFGVFSLSLVCVALA